MLNQVSEAAEAAETVVVDMRARADARAAFAVDTVTPVATELRVRADEVVARLRKVAGL